MREVYLFMLDTFRPGLRDAVAAIADAPDGGVLVNCHVGRDRTGLTVALLLELAGVPRDAVAEDFARSGARLKPYFDRLIRDAGSDEQRSAFARSADVPPEALLAALRHIDEQYGGAAGYLDDPALAGRIRARLLD